MQREISVHLRSRKRKDGRREGRYTVRYDQRGKRIIKNNLGKTQVEVKNTLSMEITEYRELYITRSGEYEVAEWLRPRFELYAKSSHSEILSTGHGGIHHPPDRPHQAEQAHHPGNSETL